MNQTSAVTCIALTLLLFGLCFVSVASATTTTFTITTSTKQYALDLPAGTIFNATITTTSTIRVWASDANGSIVANLGLVDNSAQLNFVATKGAIYTFSFENSLAESAKVTLAYQTDPELSSDNTSMLPITYLPVFIVVTVVGCILIVYFSRKNRKHTKNTE
jgi:hypothetical protein